MERGRSAGKLLLGFLVVCITAQLSMVFVKQVLTRMVDGDHMVADMWDRIMVLFLWWLFVGWSGTFLAGLVFLQNAWTRIMTRRTLWCTMVFVIGGAVFISCVTMSLQLWLKACGELMLGMAGWVDVRLDTGTREGLFTLFLWFFVDVVGIDKIWTKIWVFFQQVRHGLVAQRASLYTLLCILCAALCLGHTPIPRWAGECGASVLVPVNRVVDLSVTLLGREMGGLVGFFLSGGGAGGMLLLSLLQSVIFLVWVMRSAGLSMATRGFRRDVNRRMTDAGRHISARIASYRKEVDNPIERGPQRKEEPAKRQTKESGPKSRGVAGKEQQPPRSAGVEPAQVPQHGAGGQGAVLDPLDPLATLAGLVGGMSSTVRVCQESMTGADGVGPKTTAPGADTSQESGWQRAPPAPSSMLNQFNPPQMLILAQATAEAGRDFPQSLDEKAPQSARDPTGKIVPPGKKPGRSFSGLRGGAPALGDEEAQGTHQEAGDKAAQEVHQDRQMVFTGILGRLGITVNPEADWILGCMLQAVNLIPKLAWGQLVPSRSSVILAHLGNASSVQVVFFGVDTKMSSDTLSKHLKKNVDITSPAHIYRLSGTNHWRPSGASSPVTDEVSFMVINNHKLLHVLNGQLLCIEGVRIGV